MKVPVYIINGFLESGKTTFISETLKDPDFSENKRTLILVCEEGEAEYDEKELAACHAETVTVEEREEVTAEYLRMLAAHYRPQRVMIELNGMWSAEEFAEQELPKDWELVQIITLIDASTYQNYLSNMRSIMLGQLKLSDTIIFNRCDGTTDKLALRRSVKLMNRRGQIIYESADGVTDDAGEEVLPFDLDAELIDICDDDYGLWYMDAMDNPKKYSGKKVRFRGMVYRADKLPKRCFVPGRFAMTCCADDIAFIGFLCKVGDQVGPMPFESLKNRSFVTVTAEIRVEFSKEYRGKGPVLYALSLEEAEEPEENLVYFN